jgi:hypothetical protein
MVIVPMVIPLMQSWDSQRMAGIKTRFFRCAQNVSGQLMTQFSHCIYL